MPNTLAHLGIQTVLTRGVLRSADLRWIFLGCVIPDLPWILNRAVLSLPGEGVSPYDLRLYAIVQSSLMVCLMLCGALACFSTRPGRVFGILAANCLLHLFLDALQTKWGNGVHLMAPFSWKLTNLGLFWPEHAVTVILTVFGLAYTWLAYRRHGPGCGVALRSPSSAVLGAGLLVGYLLAPLPLVGGPAAADNHYVRTLRDFHERPGRYVELDRRPYTLSADGDRVQTFAGELLTVKSRALVRPGTVSLRGRFVDPQTIEVSELRTHWPAVRDLASYLGLALVSLAWLAGMRADRGRGSAPSSPMGLTSKG